MTFFRKMWRLSKFLLWMWPFAIYSIFRGMGGRPGIKRVAYCTRAWGKCLVRIFEVQVEFISDHPDRPARTRRLPMYGEIPPMFPTISDGFCGRSTPDG